jgi:hypothetical protein
VNPFVDLFLELVFVDEAVDLQGAEEVADAFSDTEREFLPAGGRVLRLRLNRPAERLSSLPPS